MATRLTCGLALFFLAAPGLLAQRYSFRQISEGLGDLNINCIAQDRTGYLWIGTENGLYRYDGLQFRQFGAASGIHSRTIENVYLGADGTLWVSTTTSIYFERQDGSFAEVKPPAPVDQFSQRIGTTFAALAPDRVALADRSGAFLLRRIATDQWIAERIAQPEQSGGRQIWSALAGANGELWFGCDRDLCRLAGGHITEMRAALALPDDTWLHLLRTADGHIWLRGLDHLGEIDPAVNRFVAHEVPGRTNAVPYLALAEDGSHRVIATQGAAFGIWQSGQWRMVTGRNGLAPHDLSALFIDREGSIWMGTAGHGLLRWLGHGRWESYTSAEGLSNDIVWSSLRDSSGRLWIGGESGVDYIPSGSDEPKHWTPNSISLSRAVTLAESDGIWVGSAAGVLARIDPRTLAGKTWKMPEIYRILADDGHHLWIATAGGLFLIETGSAAAAPRLVEDPAIADAHERFTDLSLDRQGQLWAASDRGLFRLDDKGWRRIDPGLSGINPLLIAAAPQGTMWATGPAAGLTRLRIEHDAIVEAAHVARPPLLSDQVVAMYVDRRGWLWAGQDNGVSVFDGQAWRSYTRADGLVWNDVDANGITEDKDGSLWIGTSGGLAHLIDAAATPAQAPGPPVFSDASFGQTSLTAGAELPWNATPLAISLSALSFRNQQHLHFRYRLLGLETQWVDTTGNDVRYPQLSPGSYTFEAEVVDTASGATSPATRLAFRISPRWWQSELLPLGIALMAGIVVVFIVRWRVLQLQDQKRQLEIAVHRRTEDLEREKAELLDARDQLRHYAEHDGLTGLWNHRIIIDRLRNEIDRSSREGTPISIILTDIDHFKHINDTFGHQAGDHVLREIGEVFTRSVRSYDWVGRYGGEEFLLILPSSGLSAARNRAEQLRIAVEGIRVRHGDHLLSVTASFGVASGFPGDYETIVQIADSALYRAKDNGRNCVMAAEVAPAENEARGIGNRA